MKIAELLYLCLTAKRSGVIQFSKGDDHGKMYIHDGEVVAAHFLDLKEEEAFFKMLLTEGANTEFSEEPVTEPKSINKSTHFLLMEAARFADEANEPADQEDTSDHSQAENFYLKFITLNDAKFSLKGTTVVIGRGDECDIVVPDISVSTKHCQILWNGKDHLLSDFGSANGTYVNNELITKSTVLVPKDDIQVGLCHFLYDILKSDDVLDDPKEVVPFTFGSQTQKIQLPPKGETGASKLASNTEFKEYTPVSNEDKKIHIWPFGNK